MNHHSHILLNPQNYVVWPPLPPESKPVFFIGPTEATNRLVRPNWRPKPDKRSESDPLRAPTGRLEGRRFHPKKKFNSRFAPFAPRNTTSFLIRAKKSGGIASSVSPATVPSPALSPAREGLTEMAKEELGINGYGSMKGLIRLRARAGDISGGAWSDRDLEEELVEVEKKLDCDVRRFEMVYTNFIIGDGKSSVLENRVDEQDSHICQLEEENLSMKEKIYVMEREIGELKRRVECLETNGGYFMENVAEIINDVAGDEGSEMSVGNYNVRD